MLCLCAAENILYKRARRSGISDPTYMYLFIYYFSFLLFQLSKYEWNKSWPVEIWKVCTLSEDAPRFQNAFLSHVNVKT